MDTRESHCLKRVVELPHGIVLVTGPTGSGKTTSLYAGLSRINTPDLKIVTIEDPVEYHLDGINQIQVDNRTGLTFAKGLRAILRHDPDVVLIGEIRDQETAEIAVQARSPATWCCRRCTPTMLQAPQPPGRHGRSPTWSPLPGSRARPAPGPVPASIAKC
jgi:Tfp pilus assembly ATPase PilU